MLLLGESKYLIGNFVLFAFLLKSLKYFIFKNVISKMLGIFL